jgi:2,4-dienoyl-CoA reductase-like NADH-dependent reductase (Old Yellow Enzyme family)|tara:strand:- start:23502 stop:24617 length:1116 start_codon:yes stop_codon:yes gene_type:complete
MEIQNRFVRSATYFGLADANGCIGDTSVQLMKALAANRVGLIMSGYAYVNRTGQVFADMNGIDADEQIPGYQRMTHAVHDEGGRICMQIAHGGVASTAAVARGERHLVVSARDARAGSSVKTVMSDADIESIIDDFGQAARRVQEAGFDGVQIHGAHGYLVTQFLSPSSNRRDDRWGGSLQNRMRFVLEVVRAIQRNVTADFPIMIKLGCRDYLDAGQGFTIEEGAEVAAALEREGVCFIEVSHGVGGRAFSKVSRGKESKPIREAYLVPDAEIIRQATTVPLAVVGGMRSLPVMESVLEAGTADCIALCRPLIRQPDLVQRWAEGYAQPADCVSCFACLKTDKDGNSDVQCREILKKQKKKKRKAVAGSH